MSRKCPSCKIDKPPSEFHKDKSRSHGLSVYCKQCTKNKYPYWKNSEARNSAAKKYYYKHRDEILKKLRARGRERSIKNKGYAVAAYNKLFDDQGGRCAICGIHSSEAYNGLHIDHDHKTQELRGLLCHKCNTGLGLFQDSIELLDIAKIYLSRKGI